MNDDNLPIWLAAAVAVIAFIIGFFCGSFSQFGYRNDAAVKAGAGEYFLDENHERQFRFKPSTVAPTPTPQPERANAD